MTKTLLFVFSLLCWQTLVIAQHTKARSAISVQRTFQNYEFANDSRLNNLFGGDQTFHGGMEIAYTRNILPWLNFEIPLRGARAMFPIDKGEPLEESLTLGMDVIGRVGPFNRTRTLAPYLYTGVGAFWDEINELSYNAPIGVGLNLKLFDNFYVTGQSEYRFGFAPDRSHLMHGLGLMVVLGNDRRKRKSDNNDLPADGDGDGVPDLVDRCPTEKGLPKTSGCPDADGDGIADREDRCPDEKGEIVYKGCPNAPDTDGDGLVDPDDRCPEVAGTMATKGCPDTDLDGIADGSDRCPNQAGSPTTSGCPDSDLDGILDGEDRCPTTAGLAEFGGCPSAPEVVTTDANVIHADLLSEAMTDVNFEFGTDRLISESRPVLERITQLLVENPQYRLHIRGYTDSIGSRADNLKLSQRRARSVRDYLMNRGIGSDRITHEGLGEQNPIATNMYKDGRLKNRRVEFELLTD